ncbi:MetQ/NlpA family ABC transporter substrate-binding protein [Clostridium folliculivorans]|uniref:Lipoprotein n=1 Tax=Clostridium folliculivorans TaxID=2886038 RepID=A0A9W5XYT8_9CLOT|nr:MetQ/NlpA family ABC transporter substrate-binding protein [Clostridium folliculivorans]GKU23423.1 lipoprotein [Clostridium folliculivorans]GKU29540.1 lipoprotein [Clostridium folliculivorans]
MKKILTLVLTLTFALSLAGCGKKEETAKKEDNKTNIVVGATLKPAGEILNYLKSDFEAKGYKLEVKIFDDYVAPNTALEEGSIDANLFQHEPYLLKFNEDHKTNLVTVKKIYLPPLGAYSKKVKDIKELKDKAVIAVPADATNESRALKLLEAQGLFKLNKKDLVTKVDIAENPKNIEIQEVDAAQLPRVLQDVDVAIINASYALPAGLDPKNDTLFSEPKDSPYANILATKKGNENAKWIKDLTDVLTSDKAKKYIEEQYKGSIIPVF